MKTPIFLTLFIFCTLLVNGQTEYLLDSTINREIFIPFFLNVETQKYFYDDNERLIRKNTKTFNESYTIYSYGSNLIVESVYTKFDGLDDFYLSNTITRYLNDDQFEIKVEHTRNEEIYYLDSIILDDRNRLIEKYSKSKDFSNNTLYLSYFEENKYKDGYLKEKRIEYYDSYDILLNAEYDSFNYNAQGFLTSEIKIWDYLTYGSYTEEKVYTYKNGTISEVKITFNWGENSENKTINRYSYNYPYYTIKEYFVNYDLESFMFEEKYKLSSSSFFEHDSIQKFNQPESINNKVLENVYTENYLEEEQLLRIRTVEKSFDFQGGLQVLNVIDEFYNKRDIQVESSLEDFTLFPNPSSVNDLIFIRPKKSDLIFNQIIIYNELGQVIVRKPVNSGRLIQFRVPNLSSGIYFMNLAYNGTIVSVAKKMVVR
jgi:hypothetical protein